MKMRIVLTTLCLALCSMVVWAQSPVQSLFDKYQDHPDFSTVTISPKMFQLIAKLDIDEVEDDLEDLVKSIKGLRILIKDSGDTDALYREASTEIGKGSYEELLTVRDEGENVRFMIKEGSGDIIEELVLLVGGGDQFVLLDLRGDMDIKDIGKLGNSLDIPGSEHLDKLEKH